MRLLQLLTVAFVVCGAIYLLGLSAYKGSILIFAAIKMLLCLGFYVIFGLDGHPIARPCRIYGHRRLYERYPVGDLWLADSRLGRRRHLCGGLCRRAARHSDASARRAITSFSSPSLSARSCASF